MNAVKRHKGARSKRQMANLLSLPNEILDKIFAKLDPESLVSLALTNKRLYDIVLLRIKRVKLKRITHTVLLFLFKTGALVQKLDLSNVVSDQIHNVLTYCPLITHLNLVNATVEYASLLRILPFLSRLISLSLTVVFKGPALNPSFSLSRSIRALYVETLPQCVLLTGVVLMIERMEALQSVHVHIVGKTADPTFTEIPALSSDRWTTLQTFVATQHWSDRRNTLIHYFVRCIFHNNPAYGVKEWLKKARDCYIFERGYFNHDAEQKIIRPGRIELLEEFQIMDLVHGRKEDRALVSTWGEPRSLRVRDEKRTSNLQNVSIFGLCTSSLVELDLVECHGAFSSSFWMRLAEQSPSLEILATPLCLFLVSAGPKGTPARENQRRLTEALQKMTLKKLYVRGYNGIQYRHVRQRRCGAALTLRNMPQMRNLSQLESLTFSDIYFDTSAAANMSHPTIHTLRLHLRGIDNFSGVAEIIQNSTNVRNFQLMGFNAPLLSTEVWDLLALGHRFERICLGTRNWSPIKITMVFCPNTTADVIHCHVPSVEGVDGSHQIEFEYIRVGDSPDFIPVCRGTAYNSRERGLCCSESFVGIPKPLRWDEPEPK